MISVPNMREPHWHDAVFLSEEMRMAAWQKLPGLAKDIGVDDTGFAWIIGTNPVPGGYGIYRWNQAINDWDAMDGGAVRIACGFYQAYVVNDVGDIYVSVDPPQNWDKLPGKAKDIGAEGVIEGPDHLSIISDELDFSPDGVSKGKGHRPLKGDFRVYAMSSASNSVWLPTGGTGVAISGGLNIRVINSKHEIYAGNWAEPNPVQWQKLPGAGKDIAVTAAGDCWLIGTNPVPGGFGIYHWNGAVNDWSPIIGGAVMIACSSQGSPWVVNDAGEIFRFVP